MPHVDEGTLHAYLDGGLAADAPRRALEVEDHLASCADCRARLDAAERIRADATEILDYAAPAGRAAPDFDEVLARAGAGGSPSALSTDGPGSRRAAPGASRSWRWTRRVAWAASLALALGTGYLLRDLTDLPAGDRPAGERSVAERSAAERAAAAPPASARVPAGGAAANVESDVGVPGTGTEASGREAPTPAPAPTAGGASSGADHEADLAAADRTAAGTSDPVAAGPPPEVEETAAGPASDAARAKGSPATVAAPMPSLVRQARPEPEALAGAARAATAEPAADPGATLVPRSPGETWIALPLDSARQLLDGPVYRLPRATIEEVYRDGAGTRVLTLQRLEAGTPVRVVQWRPVSEEVAKETVAMPEVEGRAARSLRGADQAPGTAEFARSASVRVTRDGYVLELTGTLPEALLMVLAETAEPAG